MKTICAISILMILIVGSRDALGQATKPVADSDAAGAINALRAELVDAFNKGDLDRLLSHLDDNAEITWQNGEVSRGPAELRKYYDRMMSGDKKIVKKLTVNPTVDDRHIYGDFAVSVGNLHDSYVLNDGSEFTFDSRFTATIAKRGGEWKVVSYHASVNAFSNPILMLVAKKASMWVGVVTGVFGMAIGLLAGKILGRKKKAAA